jgi:NAD(P)-dependent dehydrogenase (short-subunit alcohol dehydrogenase family)
MAINNRKRVAVVTGANRGIGFEICKELAELGVRVILTSRNEEKGSAACQQLQDRALPVRYHQLDVCTKDSINNFYTFLTKEYGRCDILINNAGIFPDAHSAGGDNWPSVFKTSIDTVRTAMETNVYGPMQVCQAIVPLMIKNHYGRIVNLSSGMGQLTYMNGHCPGYRISKTGINALTRILSEELKDYNILVNSMCPGWVKTEMGGPGATRELPEGADTAIWLATLPDGGPSGGFFRDRKEFEW